jgi:hypothetical protein
VTRTTLPPLLAAFADPAHAQAAIDELLELGIGHEHISVLANNARDEEHLNRRSGADKHLEGVVHNSRLSDLVGFLSGLGAYVLPGVGPDVATGTLASTLNAEEAGEGRGSLTGALVGLGVPVDTASYYDDQLAAGRVIVVVQGGGQSDEARAILSRQALPAPS